ncbi:hypothetical protein KY359_02645 [Candidatus Woesearchaeota archaeon]|nr:hypothetical protein [Candidatus Woesearchaeota archaeon]
MTEPVVCHEGKCSYKKRKAIDECIDCDVVEMIEHELLRESLSGTDNRHKY